MIKLIIMPSVVQIKSRKYFEVKKPAIDNGKNIQITTRPLPKMINGSLKQWIKLMMWLNIFFIGCRLYINPIKVCKKLWELARLRDMLRDNHSIIKYAKVDGLYYYTFNAPGWPSKAFNKYIRNNLLKLDKANTNITLDTILFGITKKCGYKCEHCFEWDVLNKTETLTKENILSILHSFQNAGITQIHLSGGEPLNRFDDIIFILKNIQPGTEVWLYTSGYHFTRERAALLKQEGLSGITVSLDHWIPEMHNIFRGNKNAFSWVEKAVTNARNQGLVVCLSICATKEFINTNNLIKYAELAKSWGISFIQLLEPKAVGHYADKDIYLDQSQVLQLENFYLAYNYNDAYKDYPAIVYHGFYSRRLGCNGAGNHYVYVDTDGDVHNCPFCQRKIFSALHDPLEENLRLMSSGGCSVYKNSKPK
jgi:MoaA/NifB/PqqE/SkfB family radical SAM enzyme